MKLFPDTDSGELPAEAYAAELAAMDATIEREVRYGPYVWRGDGREYWARNAFPAEPFTQ